MAAETNDKDIMGTILFKPYQDLGSSGDTSDSMDKKNHWVWVSPE
jgi:hypothetical protein